MKRITFMFLFVGLTACFENEQLSTIDGLDAESGLGIQLIEYNEMLPFTFFMDSILSNTKETLLLGKYYDPNRGLVSAFPYLQFGYESAFIFDRNASLDSIHLVLLYESTHYDTLQPFEIAIYEVTERIQPRDSGYYIYSYENFQTSEQPLLTQPVQVYPHKDSLIIRLPVELGQRLIDAGSDSQSIFQSMDDLLNSFGGLYINTNDFSPIISFSKDSYINIFYKNPGDLDRTNERYKLSIQHGYYSFTQLTIDRSQTPFEGQPVYTPIAMADSRQSVVLDQLSGAVVRIEFPDIQIINEMADTYFISSAILRIPVKTGTYDTRFNQLNSQVNVYVVDRHNVKLEGITQAGLTSYDNQFLLNTYFDVDITDFVNEILQSGQNDRAILLEIPESNNWVSNYLVLGNNSIQNNFKLNITYLPLN